MTTQLIPILVVIGVSFFFKSTRWIGLVGIAVISYFKPIETVVVGCLAGIVYWYRQHRKGKVGKD